MSNPFDLTGRTVLVTGGTRGIGRAISLRFAAVGATVVANFVRNDDAAARLQSDATEAGLSMEVLRADLTTPKGIGAALERMQAAPDLVSVVHCAATGVHRPVEELTARHFDWTMALNVRAFFELIRALLRVFRENSTIVALSSAGAVRAVPAYAAVGSSKGALEALARHMAVELAPRGVRVNILSPGSVQTEAWDAFPDREHRLEEALKRTPAGRLVSPDEVAIAAQFLCSAASSGVIGHTLVIDGGARIVE